MKKLGIIIVNYNTKDVLRDCLKNLEQLALTNTQITVVDNGSRDGSAEMISDHFPQVHLIRTENNGLATGYNIGMRNLKDVDYYLFMGSDAFPKVGCVEGVRQFMEVDPKIGAATAKLILRDGSLDMDAHRGFPVPLTSILHFASFNRYYFQTWKDLNTSHEIDLCISHFMMVKKSVFNQIGVWDEEFFVYGEDVDMCWRIKEAGFKIYYLPQFQCLHYKGVSVGIRRESLDISKVNSVTKSRMKVETSRAMRLFYEKHLARRYPWIVNKAVNLGILLVSSSRR